MKKYSFFLVTLMTVLGLSACTEDSNVLAPKQNTEEISIGQIHTEILTEIYANTDPVINKNLKQVTRDQIVINAVNRLTTKYGVESMSPQDILSYVERGRQMAQQDPVELVASLLSPEEQEWWDRFSWAAEISDARKVYNQHVRLYGAPEAGGMLAQILEVTLSSAEFWDKQRADDIQVYHNPYVPLRKGWKKFLRFAVQLVVDGAAGGAAGVGAGTVTGPVGGTIVAGVVGGLASHGADDILF